MQLTRLTDRVLVVELIRQVFAAPPFWHRHSREVTYRIQKHNPAMFHFLGVCEPLKHDAAVCRKYGTGSFEVDGLCKFGGKYAHALIRFLRQFHHWEFLVGFARPAAKSYLPTKPTGLGCSSLEHSIDESWKLLVHLEHQAETVFFGIA